MVFIRGESGSLCGHLERQAVSNMYKKMCRLIIYFFMFIVIGSGCVSDYNALGVRLFNEGRFSDAFEAFEKAYKLNPKSAFSLNNIGYVHEIRDEDYQKAFEFYNKALKACPKEAVGKSTNPKSTQGPLEELIRENLERVWIKIMRSREEKVKI